MAKIYKPGDGLFAPDAWAIFTSVIAKFTNRTFSFLDNWSISFLSTSESKDSISSAKSMTDSAVLFSSLTVVFALTFDDIINVKNRIDSACNFFFHNYLI